MTFDIDAVRHPKEKIFGAVMLVLGSLIWVVFTPAVFWMDGPIGLVVFATYALMFWLISFCARAVARAYMFGHYVMVGPEQFPSIHAMVASGAHELGLTEIPTVFVYNSGGVMNAFALRLIGRKRYIWLTSALIDADDDEQLRFVIGHELGHHVAGHLSTIPFLLRLPAHFVPLLGAAYSRSRELTCDRIGALLVPDVDTARTALQMLACGSAKLNGQMNADAFSAQDRLVPPIAGFLIKIVSTYPRLTRRVEEVGAWMGSQGMNRQGMHQATDGEPARSAA